MTSINSQKINTKEEMQNTENEYNIKLFRRTLENYTHEVFEDTKIKTITSWRKSKNKFFKSLILNIFTLGILHLISLFYPNLYIKLYCNRRKPKECDFFLVEDIYGKLTLCKKIYKKNKTQNNINISSDNSKENIANLSLSNYNKKLKNSIMKNLTYSLKYNSVTYEYNENTNEIIPVYMNLSNLTNKDIFNYFSEGLSSEGIVKIFQDRYGKNVYNLNFNLTDLFFYRNELPNIILAFILGFGEFIVSDFASFIAKTIIIILLLVTEYINMKILIYNKYKKEYTLDGEETKIRAKRSHKFDPRTEKFCYLDNCDLLPGDIIFLKTNDVVPCDCLIIEGECIANSNNLIGNLNIVRKVSLENKNIPFNYKLNKDNILYHGMKIVKTYSNLKQEYISVLCINTGPNTFKANQYSNIIYFFERKKEYKDEYIFLSKDRKSFGYIILAVIITTIFGALAYLLLMIPNKSEVINLKDKETFALFFIILARFLCKSVMPMFYLIKSVILLLGIWKLKKENIHSFEKSKLLCCSNIDTIFIGKIGTLCEDKYEINCYHPVCVNHHYINNLGFRTYNINQNKELNMQLMKYYKDYLNKNNENLNNRKDLKVDYNKGNQEMITQKCCEYSTLFLESLLSCNNLEKYGMEMFGNSIDMEIFELMKWDIKANLNYNYNINSDIDYPCHKTDYISEYSKINYYEKVRNDIFPSNYYKITESKENKKEKDQRNSINPFNFSITKIEEEKGENKDSVLTCKIIEDDISQSHINSYKLRIYKRFIKDNALSSSSITYNFITKELKFNTKGIPEDILDKCNPNTVPDNFDKIISFYRRKGLIVIICASKRINMEQYNDLDTEDKYLNNLSFNGFITLKNKLKNEVVNAFNELRLFNCNFIISTGDDIYNTLPVGFESTILDNKDIYSFDKDEIKNRIVIKKIYNSNSSSNNKGEENNNEPNNENLDKNKQTKESFMSPKTKLKQNKIHENSEKKLDKSISERNKYSFSKESISDLPTPRNKNFKNGSNINILTSSKEILNDNENFKNSISTSKLLMKKKLKMSRKNLNSIDFNFLETPKLSFMNNKKNITNDKNEILYYYPAIFEEHKELDENCIYCISGNVFEFLYQNKNKKNAKILLDKIYKKCRIYYNMTSLLKSKVIEYYRELNNNCVCTIGECQSDVDAIITSDVGINLQPPRNLNTILCHFYSPDANLLTIKKIIMEGRAINENILLLKFSFVIYTLMMNTYILICFLRQMDVNRGQLNLMEMCFLILCICAFTEKANIDKCSNVLIKKKKITYLSLCSSNWRNINYKTWRNIFAYNFI